MGERSRIRAACLMMIPDGVIGNTAGSGPVVLGSNPGWGARAGQGAVLPQASLGNGSPARRENKEAAVETAVNMKMEEPLHVVVYNPGAYEVVRIAPVKDALTLVYGRGKAEVLTVAEGSGSLFPIPTAVVLLHRVDTAWKFTVSNKPIAVSRRNVLTRDKYSCAYCGRTGNTVDHILPRTQGGLTTWENLVAACRDCNFRKGGRRPEEAEMRLLYDPWVPKNLAEMLGHAPASLMQELYGVAV